MDGIGIRDKRKVEGQGVQTGRGAAGLWWKGPKPERPPSITPVSTSQSVRPVVSRFALQARGCDAEVDNGWLRVGCAGLQSDRRAVCLTDCPGCQGGGGPVALVPALQCLGDLVKHPRTKPCCAWRTPQWWRRRGRGRRVTLTTCRGILWCGR